ncbi:hypothetical protein ACVXG8_03530 [Escherichia coli]
MSDEAHRSQVNLDQKVIVDKESGKVRKNLWLCEIPARFTANATYVGFTGTPIDATLDVFGEVIDSYTMTDPFRMKSLYASYTKAVRLK